MFLALTACQPLPWGLPLPAQPVEVASTAASAATTTPAASPPQDELPSDELVFGSLPPESIAECESGGDITAVSDNGLYMGKWQFSQGTWEGVDGEGLPSDASEEEQDYRAGILWNGGLGAGHWPNCS